MQSCLTCHLRVGLGAYAPQYTARQSTSTTTYAHAYQAATGWDFATGIRTINVSNLVAAFNEAVSPTDTQDFNGDGKSDILWHDTSSDVAIWEMNGTTILNPDTAE